ncbi:lysosomal thioesterase PPT2-like isoform X1 [Hippocampus comes]|uniref:lysosomal thioesterase PPT2-like isoform X1 n=1 Tax=Hippocampus comes TaxID=109280 RepID=UPI00094EA69F|nr:PREDICTED: lysosomal thioesterase PPT2-like isoform X1 [Hippocampus comes]
MTTPIAAILLLLVPVLLLPRGRVDGYRPVIIVHGLFDGPKQFQKMVLFIKKTHPGTEVTVVDMYNHMSSLKPLWKQVQGFHLAIEPIMMKALDGVHMLCFSQGGLICRALLSTMPNHNIHTFIALSSPLAGQYGDTDYLQRVFPSFMKTTVFRVCYNRVGQKVSICQYWNDPHHRSSYLKNNKFLPLLNGDTPHSKLKSWRENFLRIKKLVLIGGPDDGVITPWQSSHFGFYDSKEHVVEMRNQEFYRNDTFGLKTLSARGDLSLCLRAGVKHIHWHSNFTVFTDCIENWLT